MRLNIYTYIHVVIRRNMYTCVDSYVIIYIYYKLVFCNHNTMRGSCCLRCIHLLFLLIFLLSISTLSINLYLSTFSINLSLPDLSLSFYVSTSPTSPTSLSLINSLPTCLALSTSVAAWRLPLLASQNASTFRHFAIDSRSSALVSKCLCSPREGRPNAETSPPSCRSRGNVKNLSSRTSKV